MKQKVEQSLFVEIGLTVEQSQKVVAHVESILNPLFDALVAIRDDAQEKVTAINEAKHALNRETLAVLKQKHAQPQ